MKHVICYKWRFLEETVLRKATVNLNIKVILQESKHETGNSSALREPMHLTRNDEMVRKSSMEHTAYKMLDGKPQEQTLGRPNCNGLVLMLFSNAVSTTDVK
jgi:hypothetical protein